MATHPKHLVYPLFLGNRNFCKSSVLPSKYCMDRPKFSLFEHSNSFDSALSELNPLFSYFSYKIHFITDNLLFHSLYIEDVGTIRLQTSSLIPLSFRTSKLMNGEKEPVSDVCFVFIEEIRLALPQVAFDLYFTHRLQEIILETIVASLSGTRFDWQQHLRNAYDIICASCRANKIEGLSCPEVCP